MCVAQYLYAVKCRCVCVCVCVCVSVSVCCLHADDVLDAEVLQRRSVWVLSLVVLQDDLLEDPVQELPVLQAASPSLI